MSKTPRKGPEYSREREWGVLLEDLHSQFRTFGEGLKDVRNRLGRVETDLTQVKEDVGELKVQMAFVFKALPTIATKDDLRLFDKRLIVLETSR